MHDPKSLDENDWKCLRISLTANFVQLHPYARTSRIQLRSLAKDDIEAGSLTQ